MSPYAGRLKADLEGTLYADRVRGLSDDWLAGWMTAYFDENVAAVPGGYDMVTLIPAVAEHRHILDDGDDFDYFALVVWSEVEPQGDDGGPPEGPHGVREVDLPDPWEEAPVLDRQCPRCVRDDGDGNVEEQVVTVLPASGLYCEVCCGWHHVPQRVAAAMHDDPDEEREVMHVAGLGMVNDLPDGRLPEALLKRERKRRGGDAA